MFNEDSNQPAHPGSLSANHNNCRLLCHLLVILKANFANSVDPDQTAPLGDLGPHCLPVCKNRFEKFARIFRRRHKQMTFSDAVFLGALRVKKLYILGYREVTLKILIRLHKRTG